MLIKTAGSPIFSYDKIFYLTDTCKTLNSEIQCLKKVAKLYVLHIISTGQCLFLITQA